MEQLIDILLNSFDFGYMFAVNILTYSIIKTIDSLNGDKAVPSWQKRIISLICGIVLGIVVGFTSGFSTILIYSFILSLVSWDALFKPILKKLKYIDYKKSNDNGCEI